MTLTIDPSTTFSYSHTHILHFPPYTLPANSVLGIQGSNGAGKTTLLKLIAGIIFPHTGGIRYNNTLITKKNALHIRQHITLLLQEAYVFKRTVYDNLVYPLLLRKQHFTKSMLVETLHNVGLCKQLLYKHAHTLSGGERQKLALAMRLLCNPSILLLDEPTANIDEKAVHQLASLIAERRKHTTFVIVSHDKQWLHTISTHMLHL